MSRALLLIDFVNENVNPKGKMAGKGYPDYCERHQVISNAKKLLEVFRKRQDTVVHVKVGFSPDYKEQPLSSPLFGAANKFGAFMLGEFGDEFCDELKPINGESQIIKHRVSAFYGTSLELLLRNKGVTDLYVCGVATDLAVQAATRDAHDRDFMVTVVEDCCGAANENDHNSSLIPLKKISNVSTLAEVISNM